MRADACSRVRFVTTILNNLSTSSQHHELPTSSSIQDTSDASCSSHMTFARLTLINILDEIRILVHRSSFPSTCCTLARPHDDKPSGGSPAFESADNRAAQVTAAPWYNGHLSPALRADE
jgi:hypothetical protein